MNMIPVILNFGKYFIAPKGMAHAPVKVYFNLKNLHAHILYIRDAHKPDSPRDCPGRARFGQRKK